jgi:choline dehydrogenase-like flavoprotein
VSARLEVVLCTGSIDTPKLLLLSGIGPPQELSELNIEVQHALPGVGKNLQDHCGVFLAEHLGPLFSERVTFSLSPDKMEEAHKQWMTDHTGQLAAHYSSLVIGFIKDPSWFEMEEFKALPLDEQHFLRDPTIPTYELAMVRICIPPISLSKLTFHT